MSTKTSLSKAICYITEPLSKHTLGPERCSLVWEKPSCTPNPLSWESVAKQESNAANPRKAGKSFGFVRCKHQALVGKYRARRPKIPCPRKTSPSSPETWTELAQKAEDIKTHISLRPDCLAGSLQQKALEELIKIMVTALTTIEANQSTATGFQV